MGQPKTAAGFATTRWTLIARAKDDRTAMDELLSIYWSPVYSFLRRSGLNRDDAADLTQEFLTEAVVDGTLLSKADPTRGRFRWFLQRAVRNYMIDHYRREKARVAGRDRTPWDEAMLDAAEPRDEDDPSLAFDRQYATTIVNLALQYLEATCESQGMTSQWTVFNERMLRPLRGGEAAAIDDLAARVNARSPQVVYSMNQTMNRKFEAALEMVIAQTVERDADVADEKRQILRILGVAV